MTDTAPIVILDTETTGLDRMRDQVWDFAARRHDPDGTVTQWNVRVRHDETLAEALPDPFRTDHDARYRYEDAIHPWDLARLLIGEVFVVPDGTPYRLRPHVVGACPDFDLAHLERVVRECAGVMPPWHHHVMDVETLAIGWLRGRASVRNAVRAQQQFPQDEPFPGPPWDSEDVSRAVGVDPDEFARHTALGDVLWAEAIWQAVNR